VAVDASDLIQAQLAVLEEQAQAREQMGKARRQRDAVLKRMTSKGGVKRGGGGEWVEEEEEEEEE